MALEQDTPHVPLERKETRAAQAQETQAEEAEIAEHMAVESPEGRPGGAMIHGSSLGVMFILVFGSMIVIGILVAIFWTWYAGLAAAGLGIALMLFNPVVWANFLRGREHDQIKKEEI